jgi:hypothetical protein
MFCTLGLVTYVFNFLAISDLVVFLSSTGLIFADVVTHILPF